MTITLEKAFGTVLSLSRINKGLSQEKLALLSGLDRTSISRLERGLRTPNIKTIFILAKVLDIRPYEIIKQTEAAL